MIASAEYRPCRSYRHDRVGRITGFLAQQVHPAQPFHSIGRNRDVRRFPLAG
jgi:hypothetical protein